MPRPFLAMIRKQWADFANGEGVRVGGGDDARVRVGLAGPGGWSWWPPPSVPARHAATRRDVRRTSAGRRRGPDRKLG